MTLQTIAPSRLWAFPYAAARAFGSSALDANGEKAGIIFRAPKAGNIDRVCFRTGTVTTGDTMDVRLETVDTTTGQPTGTLFGTNTNASHVIGNGDDNLWIEVTLTAAAAVARSDRLALVVALPAAGAVGNMGIANATISAGESSGAYAMNYTTAWTAAASAAPIGAVRYSDGTYPFVPGLLPASSINDVAFGTGSSPDERGNKITAPFPCTVAGLWCKLASNAAGQTGDFDVVLYDDANNVLGSASHIGDLIATNSTLDLWFASDVTLTAGQVVRAVKKPTTASTTAFSDVVAPSGVGSALPGGTASVYTERVDGGAWTDVSNRWAEIGLIVSALDDGAGGAAGGGAARRVWGRGGQH